MDPKICWILPFLIGYVASRSCNDPGFNKTAKTDTSRTLNLPFKIPYYGNFYNYLYIDAAGFVGLNPSSLATSDNIGSFPVTSGGVDPPVILPFYVRTKFSPEHDEGQLCYRIIHGGTENPKITELNAVAEIRDRIRENVVGAEHFEPTSMIEVFWDGLMWDRAPNDSPRNYFRIIIAVDNTNTYVNFIYDKINWNTEAGRKQYPSIGFNAGDGRNWYPYPWSESEKSIDIDTIEAANNITEIGSLYFEVSGESVLRGGCIPPTLAAGKTTDDPVFQMTMTPSSGSMMGMSKIMLNGPCVDHTKEYKCNFPGTNPEITSVAHTINRAKLWCTLPAYYNLGDVTVRLSDDFAGSGDIYSAQYNIHVIDFVPSQVELESPMTWNNIQSKELAFKWDPMAINAVPSADINIYGYTENKNTHEWKLLSKIGDIPNHGTFTIQTNTLECLIGDCSPYGTGAIQVTVAGQEAGIWSPIVPLGWFHNRDKSAEDAKDWAMGKCSEFGKTATEDWAQTKWFDSIPECPCSLEQAEADFGRWIPDPSCNQHKANPLKCTNHVGAKHCVRSIDPSKDFAGTQCCYTEGGLLMYSGDSKEGSSSDRAFPFGTAPYNAEYKVPTLSHWHHDNIPYFHCCKWSQMCSTYMNVRKTKECTSYVPPSIAAVYGDPHFITFDGHPYTFNGVGTYWLTKEVSETGFRLQAIFEIPKWILSDAKATVMTGVAIQTKEGPVIEIHVSDPAWYDVQKLTVSVDKKIQDFSGMNYQVFHLKGSTLVIRKATEYQYVVLLPDGNGVRINERNKLIDVSVSGVPALKGQVSGLLGTWDDDPTNDIQSTGNDEDDFHMLRNQNEVLSNANLFQKKVGVDRNFVPNFNVTMPESNARFDVNAICDTNKPCIYDLATLNNQLIAGDTKKANEAYLKVREGTKAVETCGWLPIPNSIKNSIDYRVGKEVIIEGCQDGFAQKGALVSYECVADANGGKPKWQPDIGVECEPVALKTSGGSDETTIIIVVVVVILLIVILAVVAIVFVLSRRFLPPNESSRRKKPSDPETKDGDADADVVAGSKDPVAPDANDKDKKAKEPGVFYSNAAGPDAQSEHSTVDFKDPDQYSFHSRHTASRAGSHAGSTTEINVEPNDSSIVGTNV